MLLSVIYATRIASQKICLYSFIRVVNSVTLLYSLAIKNKNKSKNKTKPSKSQKTTTTTTKPPNQKHTKNTKNKHANKKQRKKLANISKFPLYIVPK